jgi:hypothetical protein
LIIIPKKNIMKRYLFVLISCCCLLSCTKEGLPGPQGPEGPEGPAGEPGTGGGGTATNIISVITPATATFTWEQFSRSATNIVYRLKWRSGATEGTTFRLPDSLTTRIDNGALLVYATNSSNDFSDNITVQLAYAPAEFYPLSTYIYQLEKIAGRYVITVLADMEDWGSTDPRLPRKFSSLKFLIIPQTGTGTIGWG